MDYLAKILELVDIVFFHLPTLKPISHHIQSFARIRSCIANEAEIKKRLNLQEIQLRHYQLRLTYCREIRPHRNVLTFKKKAHIRQRIPVFHHYIRRSTMFYIANLIHSQIYRHRTWVESVIRFRLQKVCISRLLLTKKALYCFIFVFTIFSYVISQSCYRYFHIVRSIFS